MTRKLISQGSSFEREIGYSRAVVDADMIYISGTTGFDFETMTISDDVAAQAKQCLANIEWALTQADATFDDVVRVRYIFPTASDFLKCWAVLSSFFAKVRPAATMFSASLADPRMKIEIEVTARRQQKH